MPGHVLPFDCLSNFCLHGQMVACLLGQFCLSLVASFILPVDLFSLLVASFCLGTLVSLIMPGQL